MDHSYIEDHQVVERYLMKRLGEHEAARFEEHYLHCPRCLDELELGERLLGGLEALAAEEKREWMPVERGHSGVWWRIVLLTLALVALWILPNSWLVQEVSELEDDLEGTAALASKVVRERLDETKWRLERGLVDLEAPSPPTMEIELEQAISELETRLDDLRQPQARVSLMRLFEQVDAEDPPQELALPKRFDWIVLSLELESAPCCSSYRAVLRHDGHPAWQGQDLKPVEMGSAETLLVSVPASFLTVGEYELKIEAETERAVPDWEARFVFRIRPTFNVPMGSLVATALVQRAGR